MNEFPSSCFSYMMEKNCYVKSATKLDFIKRDSWWKNDFFVCVVVPAFSFFFFFLMNDDACLLYALLFVLWIFYGNIVFNFLIVNLYYEYCLKYEKVLIAVRQKIDNFNVFLKLDWSLPFPFSFFGELINILRFNIYWCQFSNHS